MKQSRIASVEPLDYPILRVIFEDGLSGVLDLSETIAQGPIFGPLKDEAYFRTVAVSEGGHTFGWNLNDPGHEIDFCPDAARIEVETAIVEAMADRFEATRAAAE